MGNGKASALPGHGSARKMTGWNKPKLRYGFLRGMTTIEKAGRVVTAGEMLTKLV